ncbi:Ig-like domain-containing protein [uncultured Methanobrevibacter sp.]|uniref:Ig-like domain-containing protein n=1 Tax=uncultured Methanobrevibacter sp. TaxID=253161 RepID=UPI0025FB88F8|nr:Ig-like domain-containing protein [uncultured Methanobrevibacter sp.]
MSFLDLIRELLGNNKKNAQLITKDLCKVYGEKDQLEVALYEGNIPLVNKIVTFNVNGRDYERKTDESGIARLNINLNPGVYTPLISFKDDNYNLVTAFCNIIVQTETRIEGTDINMTYRDGTVYQCAVYDHVGRVAGNVRLTVNGREYIRNCDSTGLYKLNINLEPGTYEIVAEFLGDDYHLPSNVTNKIVINPKPEPKPEPQKSRSEKILDYFESKFGRCEYIDDALAKIQSRGYRFYFSDGYNMYETIDRVFNGDGANCFDIAEVLYHLARGMNTKYGRNYEVQYLDVWCPVSRYDHIRLRLRSNGSDWFYRDGACVLDGGDITDNWCGTSDNILEVNPDWIHDGD